MQTFRSFQSPEKSLNQTCSMTGRKVNAETLITPIREIKRQRQQFLSWVSSEKKIFFLNSVSIEIDRRTALIYLISKTQRIN